LLGSNPWLKDAAPVVRNHHKKWSDWDRPIDDPLVIASQIVSLADRLERSVGRGNYILHQCDALCAKILAQSGSGFHPDIVECFISTANREEFWLDLVSPRLYSVILHHGPYKKNGKNLGRSPVFARKCFKAGGLTLTQSSAMGLWVIFFRTSKTMP